MSPFRWLLAWWQGRTLGRRAARLERQLSVSRIAMMTAARELEAARNDGSVGRARELFEEAEIRWAGKISAAEATIKAASRVIENNEAALAELRAEQKVNKLTIETLVASHKLLTKRYDAEVAIQSRKFAGVANRGEE